jgi:magnesium chelatase family protein
VSLHPVRAAALLDELAAAECSETVAERVRAARAAAAERWAAIGARSNSAVPAAMLRRPPWRLARSVSRVLVDALDSGRLSARGHDRVIRVAWTIADLDGRDRPTAQDLAEALELREGTAS